MKLDRTVSYILVAGLLVLGVPMSGWGGAQDIIFENSSKLTQSDSPIQGRHQVRGTTSQDSNLSSFQSLRSPSDGSSRAHRQEQQTWSAWFRDFLTLVLGEKLRLF